MMRHKYCIIPAAALLLACMPLPAAAAPGAGPYQSNSTSAASSGQIRAAAGESAPNTAAEPTGTLKTAAGENAPNTAAEPTGALKTAAGENAPNTAAEPTAAPSPSEAPAPTAAPVPLKNYEGTWYGVYMETPILTGNPRTKWNLHITLSLYPDHTGILDYLGEDSGMVWFRRGGGVWYGDAEGEQEPVKLTLLEGGFLQYETAADGIIIFSQDKDAVWTEDYETLKGAASDESGASGSLSEKDALPAEEVIYVCTGGEAGGFSFDPSRLGGEFSFVLHGDGTADLTLAGETITGLSWKAGESGAEIDYFGTPLSIEPSQAGFILHCTEDLALSFTEGS